MVHILQILSRDLFFFEGSFSFWEDSYLLPGIKFLVRLKRGALRFSAPVCSSFVPVCVGKTNLISRSAWVYVCLCSSSVVLAFESASDSGRGSATSILWGTKACSLSKTAMRFVSLEALCTLHVMILIVFLRISRISCGFG